MKAWIEHKTVRQGLTILNWVLAIAPITLLVGLVAMAERATQILGQIPKPSIDDPKFLGHSDVLYQHWISIAETGLWLTLISWLPWCCLTALTIFCHWRYWSKTEAKSPQSTIVRRFLPIMLYVLTHGILFFEPFGLLSWFLD